MIQSAITISLVNEARGGPFVFWNDLAVACAKSAELGFDAVEVFAPSAQAVTHEILEPPLKRSGLKLAALGTGAGWLIHKLTLTSADPEIRSRAREFIRSIVDAAGRLGAPAIIGSMQGRFGEAVSRDDAMRYLAEALEDLGEHAAHYRLPLLYEPLNRYETNLVNTLADGSALLRSLRTRHVKLLADLFHMNIEEANVAAALRAAGSDVGHVHLADSNRRPAGNGHTDFAPIARALHAIGYRGYVSAECFSYPDADAAAASTIRAFRQFFAEPPAASR